MVLDLLNKELKQYSKKQLENTLGLLAEGNTIPFIARYRKELTGSLDEVQIKEIADRHQYLENLENRKEEIIRLISEQDKMTDELQAEIMKADKLNQLEDLYRPYRPKRRTKAVIAREKGLEPLAEYILSMPLEGDIDVIAQGYVSDEVPSIEEALEGAHEIMAEVFGDEPEYRRYIRAHTFRNGVVSTTIAKGELDEKKVVLSGHSAQVGNFEEELDILGADGNPLSISFNPDYMKDALRAFGDTTIRICFISAVRPFTLEPSEGQGDFLQLITPVRTN